MKLTRDQFFDRLTMYEEAAGHLEMAVCETEGEREQAKIISRQIRALSKKLENKYPEYYNPKTPPHAK